MTVGGVGGSKGGGLCKRSITDFATSAADLIVSGGVAVPGFEPRPWMRRLGAAVAARTAGLSLTFGLAAASNAGFDLADFRLAAGAPAGPARTAAAASTFRRACFATFLAALDNFRASLSLAFAVRTSSFAAAANCAAFSAADLSRFIVFGSVAIQPQGKTRNKNSRISATSWAQTA
jgi:hypothetical protein